MLKFFLCSLTIIFLWGYIAPECNSTANNSWDEWENCTVTRIRVRNCTVTNDCGPDNDTTVTDIISNFTTCPLISDDDIAMIQTVRNCETQEELSNIKNSTEKALSDIKKKYENAMYASTGFGYIAALSIVLIFSFPIIIDLINIVVHCSNKKKIHSEIRKRKAPKLKQRVDSDEIVSNNQEVPKYIE